MASVIGSARPAKLIVERVSDQDIKMRGLKVLLDGNYLTDLSFGNTVDFDIASGKHVVKVSNSLYSSELEFEASPGEETAFSAGNVMRGFGAMMFVALGIGPYRVFLERKKPA